MEYLVTIKKVFGKDTHKAIWQDTIKSKSKAFDLASSALEAGHRVSIVPKY